MKIEEDIFCKFTTQYFDERSELAEQVGEHESERASEWLSDMETKIGVHVRGFMYFEKYRTL